MNDIETKEVESSTTSVTLLEQNKIVKVDISFNHIQENGTLSLTATITGTGGVNLVALNSLDIYVDGSLSYTSKYNYQISSPITINNIGISNAAHNASHTSISVYVVAHGYNDVTSNTITRKLPTADDLSKEFIHSNGLIESKNTYDFTIKTNYDYYTTDGTIYYTTDGSNPADSSNTNRQVYKDNIHINIPNVPGSYTIRAYHVIGQIGVELESYSFSIDSTLYDTPDIVYNEDANFINFSKFPTNKPSDATLLLQYQINYDDGTEDTTNLNIGDDTSKYVVPTKNGKVRCRIVDSRGESYGCSLWSAYISFTITFTRFDFPTISVDFDNYEIKFSNINTDAYLYINILYNDGTSETIQKKEGDSNGVYILEYTKSGKLNCTLVDKRGYDYGHTIPDYSDYVNFTIKGEVIPELYNTPKLTIGTNNNVIISNITSGYEVQYQIIYDYNNDGSDDETIDYSNKDYENTIDVQVGKYAGKIKARLVNLKGASVGASDWSDYLSFNFYESSEEDIHLLTPNIAYEQVEIDGVIKVKVTFNKPSSETNSYTSVLYTTDGTNPTVNSNKATIANGFYITPTSNTLIIYYKAYYNYNDKDYFSNIGSAVIQINNPDNPGDTNDNNANNPFYYGYNKPALTNKVVKNYIDIIYSRDIESTKALDSIQYILDVINKPFGTINVAEQAFARLENHKDGRYSGDYLVLYSDETYSGQIDINDKGDNNIMDNYKYPTFQKGHWEFNNFRNGGTQLITADELAKVYTNIPYVDDKGNTIVATITLKDLYESFGITSTESGIALRSDNRSLIYGKYIVARFIFNNDKKIKLQNVTFITNNY